MKTPGAWGKIEIQMTLQNFLYPHYDIRIYDEKEGNKAEVEYWYEGFYGARKQFYLVSMQDRENSLVRAIRDTEPKNRSKALIAQVRGALCITRYKEEHIKFNSSEYTSLMTDIIAAKLERARLFEELKARIDLTPEKKELESIEISIEKLERILYETS